MYIQLSHVQSDLNPTINLMCKSSLTRQVRRSQSQDRFFHNPKHPLMKLFPEAVVIYVEHCLPLTEFLSCKCSMLCYSKLLGYP